MELMKYPRSWHLPYSEKGTDDDKKHYSDEHLHGKHVIVTLKQDGENTSMYPHTIHARSMNSLIDDESRRLMDTIRKTRVSGNIPDTFRVCGENMFYKHTIEYNELEAMFQVFSIWDGERCLSWADTVEYCEFMDLYHVPVMYEGIYDGDKILKLYKEKYSHCEGFVVRLADDFMMDDFSVSLNKFVSSSFIISDVHWRYTVKQKNKLKNNQDPWIYLK